MGIDIHMKFLLKKPNTEIGICDLFLVELDPWVLALLRGLNAVNILVSNLCDSKESFSF